MPHRRVVIYHKNSNQALAFLPFAPVASEYRCFFPGIRHLVLQSYF